LADPQALVAANDFVAVARELQPLLRERADEVERARRLPPDLSRTLARAGLYRLWVPECYGGVELPLVPALRTLETLAQAEGSVAWCVFIAITSSVTVARIPADAAREICASPETLIGGVYAPHGRADAAAGGFRVNGQWAFGSGTQNADWVCAGARFFRDDQPLEAAGVPRQHMVLVPAYQVEFLDTWHVAGLCGTGSTDFRLNEVVVPEDRVVGWERTQRVDRPLYRLPEFTLLASGFGPVVLGMARAALDEFVALATEKTPTGARRKLAERGDVQSGVARAEATLRSARAFLYETMESTWQAICSEGRLSLEERRDVRLAASHAAQSAVAVVDAMYHLAGGTSLYRKSPLQRIFRDTHAATQHVMLQPPTFELAGRAFLHLPKGTALL
jgi:alkylation response protein AidB-like acyl-CoA dehydrogenase